MRSLVMICLLATSGCSMSSLAPLAGSAAGAGVGALAGPGGAVGGSIVGYAGGAAYKLSETGGFGTVSEAAVQALVAQGLEGQKGVFSDMIDGVYDLLKLAAIGLGVWFAVHVWHSGHLHIKLKKTGEKA